MNKKITPDFINEFVKDTLIDYLGIEFIKVGDGTLEATMPINKHTHNPARILHGGAMMALAESIGSALSFLYINPEKQDVRGVEINGNHVRSASEGKVRAVAKLLHQGRRTHVCEIKIYDCNDNLLNISRMTNMVVDKE